MMTDETHALSLEGVRKRIDGRNVLEQIDLELPAGELMTILGSSGAGKTTLLRLIAGLEPLDDGTIRLDGRVVACPGSALPPEKRRIGYLAQEGALFPHLSVADNIAFGLKGARRAHARIVERMLELVSLPVDYAKRHPHQLSGGEQQRVALARALAPNPSLVLLDEPFSSLDAGLRAEVREAVSSGLKQVGASAVLVTHDPSEAMSMGDRVAVLMHGQVAQCADPVSLYRRPVNPEVGRFVGQAILLEGTGRDGQVLCPLGALDSDRRIKNSDAVRVLIRPEQIGLVPYGAPESVAADTTEIRYFGRDALIGLRLHELAEVSITARVFSHAIPRLGDRVGITVTGRVCSYPLAAPADALPRIGIPQVEHGDRDALGKPRVL
jgi:iron(III) transport system ATP-binding protein